MFPNSAVSFVGGRGGRVRLLVAALAALALDGASALVASGEAGGGACLAASLGCFVLGRGPVREEADDGAGGGGGGGGEAKLTLGQKLSAALSSKTALQATIAERDTAIEGHMADLQAKAEEIARLQGELQTQTARITELEGQMAEVQTALDGHQAEVTRLKSEAKTASERSKTDLASLGVDKSALPAPNQQGGGAGMTNAEKLADLNTRIEACKDPIEAGRMRNEAWDLMKKMGGAGRN